MSGILQEDCEQKTDKKGHNYIRFKVACHGIDPTGNTRLNTYKCYTYNTQFSNLKKGDLVFITGTLNIYLYKGVINLDVYVQHLTPGIK